VSSPSASSAHALDETLARLPGGVGLAHRGGDRFVTGPGGAFVLHPLEPHEALGDAVDHAHLLAQTTRDRIARHLNWVPFVDWFVVDDGDNYRIPVLPTSMVAAIVLKGHVIPPNVADELHHHIAAGGLAPLWLVGLPLVSNDLVEVATQLHPMS